MQRGCCCVCLTLEACVQVQAVVVGLVCALNIARVAVKTALLDDSDSVVKQTRAGVYMDGIDFIVNGLGAAMLLVACVMLLRGVHQKRPALMQPYLVVAMVIVASLAVYAVVCGVAVIESLPESDPDRRYLSAGEVVALVVAALLLLIAFPTYFLLNVSSLMDYMNSDGYRVEHFYYIGT